MSEIDEIPEDEFVDETINGTDSPKNNSTLIAAQIGDDRYDFDKTTILIGLQILPAISQSQRQILISAGIKGEPPILSNTTFDEIEKCQIIAEILFRLKQKLPEIADLVQSRQEKQRTLSQKPQKITIGSPELPLNNSTSQPSNQLSLF